MFTVELLTIAQIMGDIVVGSQLIGREDTFIEQLSHQTMVLVVRALFKLAQVGLCHLRTDRDIHTPFGLDDTSEDAVQVLTRFLDILSGT